MSKLPKQMNGVEKLSADCWQLVFDHLNQDELKTASMVCKDFLTITNFVKQSLKVVHPEVSKLSRYLKRFERLRSIDMSKFKGELHEAICEVARSELSLEALYCCPDVAFVTEDVIRELSSSPKMKNLKTLSLNTLDYMRDNNLIVIANSFPDLEEPEISVCSPGLKSEYFPAGHAIKYLAPKLKLLTNITLHGRNMISDQSLLALFVECLFLKDVTITNYGGLVAENGIGLLLRHRPNLEALSVGFITKHSSSTITNENSISHARALTSLNFTGKNISNKLLNEIAKAKVRLKVLGLIPCWSFTLMGLHMVSSSYLNKLCINVSDSNISDADLSLFFKGNLGNLITHIEINGCPVTNSTFFLLLNMCPSLV